MATRIGLHVIDRYVAHKSVAADASAAAIKSAYRIEVRFLGGLTASQQSAFETAADRWTTVIVGDLPSVRIDGEVIDDLLIEAKGLDIDGPRGVLGQAGPTHLRPESAGPSALLPAKGIMLFDTADLAAMEADGTLVDVITHEMGHVLGIGTLWEDKGLLAIARTSNPTFTGIHARRAFGALKGRGPTAVPVENTGGEGTRDSHWRESVFRHELMSGFISGPRNPLSRLTVASLQDLGYRVDLNAAEPYTLPKPQRDADRGAPAMPVRRHALPTYSPEVLPDDSLVV
jgi:hypothetical protein